MNSITDVQPGAAFLIDSNVLLDVITSDPNWSEWSAEALAQCVRVAPCFINPIIYSEIAYGFDDLDDLNRVIPVTAVRRAAIPFPAAFLAAKAHQSYRRRGGAKTATLPDFFIGAHALVDRLTIVTRDARRYAQAFPSVRVLSP